MLHLQGNYINLPSLHLLDLLFTSSHLHHMVLKLYLYELLDLHFISTMQYKDLVFQRVSCEQLQEREDDKLT